MAVIGRRFNGLPSGTIGGILKNAYQIRLIKGITMQKFNEEQLIEAINTLKSDCGENKEYDRALAEVFHWFFGHTETPNPIPEHCPE
jgi:hypothetical protein